MSVNLTTRKTLGRNRLVFGRFFLEEPEVEDVSFGVDGDVEATIGVDLEAASSGGGWECHDE